MISCSSVSNSLSFLSRFLCCVFCAVACYMYHRISEVPLPDLIRSWFCDAGFKHILEHHGSGRSEVYRRIFQVLWFGSQMGKKEGNSGTPAHIGLYPEELRQFFRLRLPDPGSGVRDAEFSGRENVLHIAWQNLVAAK